MHYKLCLFNFVFWRDWPSEKLQIISHHQNILYNSEQMDYKMCPRLTGNDDIN